MAIHLGDTALSKVYLGTTQATKAYLGTTEIYSSGPVGLLAHYECEEGSGTTLLDSSANANHAALIETDPWISGPVGLAIDLGSSNYGTAPHQDYLNVGNAFTLAAWIRPDKLGTAYILKKAENVDGYELSLSSGGKPFVRVNKETNGNTYRLNAVTSYPSNGLTWMHLCATFDNGSMKLYINGALDASTTGVPTPASNTVALGVGGTPSYSLNGAIDDARVYGVALSDADVLALYQMGT